MTDGVINLYQRNSLSYYIKRTFEHDDMEINEWGIDAFVDLQRLST